MQKITPLQAGFCISVAFHVLVLGAYGVSKFHPAEIHRQGDDSLALTMIESPAQPGSLPMLKVIAPVPMPARPVQKTSPPQISPQLVPSSPRPAVAVLQPEPIEVVEKPAAQPAPRADMILTKSGEDSLDVRAQPLVKTKSDYLKNPDPVYPEVARRRHEQGLVLLTVGITADGRVEHIAVKKSSGFPLLDKAALEAVRDWEFKPASLGPVSLASEIEVPVHFEIQQ